MERLTLKEVIVMNLKERIKNELCAKCTSPENPKNLLVDCQALAVGKKQGGCILNNRLYIIK